MVFAAKSADCIDKCFEQKLYKIKFPTKNSEGARLYLLQEWSQRAPKICQFWNSALEWESMFTLGLSAAKSTDYPLPPSHYMFPPP